MLLKRAMVTFVLSIGSIHAAPWSTPATIQTPPTLQAFEDVTLSYNSTSGQILATWQDNTSHLPYYSIYTTGWSAPQRIPGTSTVKVLIKTASELAAGRFIATWADGSTSLPTYSIFTSGTWSTAASFGTVTALGDVNVSFDSLTSEFLATWTTTAAGNATYYSIFNVGSWSTPALIGSSVAVSDVVNAFDPATPQFLAVWATSGSLEYSIFNGSTWTAAAPIPGSVSSAPFVAFNPSTGQFIATWTSSAIPISSFFSSGAWSASPVTISNTFPVLNEVFPSYDSGTGQFNATWVDTRDHPTFAFYDGTSWTTSNITTAFLADFNVFSVFDASTDQIFATWTDASTLFPTYSFNLAPPTSAPPPPSNFQGVQKKNNFAIESELFNQLTWVYPITSSTIVSYKVYRDGVVIAQLPVLQFEYEDHNRTKNVSYTYSITSIDSSGNESSITSANTIIVPE